MRIHPHLRSFCLAALLPLAALASAAERAPNIIVIMADDLGVRDMALYDGWVKMPAIENMARQGMTMHNFHTNSSVCGPTRF
ncbi:MAG: sulfatase-like hydrolase/transferase [Luteolibacter sp.]